MHLHLTRAVWRVILLCFFAITTQAQATQVPGPLVDTKWLSENMGNVVILDVRQNKQSFIRKSSGGGGEVAGVQACGAKSSVRKVSGHIPGSALVEWKDIAVKNKIGDTVLFDMVPDKGAFEELMQQSGVNKNSAIIVVSPSGSAPSVGDASRLYWTLKYYGHDNMAALDGGVAKWTAEKRKIEYGRSRPDKGDWRAAAVERREILATLDDVQKATQDGNAQILDIRPPQFYLGLMHQAKKAAKKGHIPGAKNLHHMVLIKGGKKGATIYGVKELKRVAAELGVDPAKPSIFYCYTGALASTGWFIMHELLGNKNASLYVGSLNEWAADPARPVSIKAE